MHKYRVTKYGIEIEKREITKETKNFVTILEDIGNSRKRERKVAKESEYDRYFDSFYEAKQYLLERESKRMEYAQRDVENYMKNIVEIKSLSDEA